jgi:hypothetical protein
VMEHQAHAHTQVVSYSKILLENEKEKMI